MSDLKSCPFCGSAKIEFRDIAQQTLVAVCCGCNAEGGYNTIEHASTSREQAVAAWNRRASPEIGERAELLERELKRCHEAIGAYVIAQAYADTLPDDAEDAADMTFGQHYWEGAASHWAGEDLLSRAHEAAKARMRVENPVQVRDLDWSAAMGDVVASGGLPQDKDEDEDPVCTGCGGSGITYQTERPCACIPTALSAPSPSADALRPGEPEDHLSQLSRIFGRKVTRFKVPGRVDGIQRMEVGFADGDSITTTGADVDSAWRALLAEAETATPDPSNTQAQKMEEG